MMNRGGTETVNSSLSGPHVSLSVVGQTGSATGSSLARKCEALASKAGVQSVQTENCLLSWIGLVYVDGKQAGRDSIQHFLKQVRDGLTGAAAGLKGVYFIVLLDKSSGETYAFTDSSGLLHVFHSADCVSSSFLELVAHHRLGLPDLSPEALVEFFHFGYLSFGRTFFDSIKRLGPHQIARVDPSGRLTFIPKSKKGIDQLTVDRSFEDLLRGFASSCSEEKISVDLTGGIDSRLLAVVLEYLGVPFDLAVGGDEGNEDVAIATEVSKLMNRPLHIMHQDITNFEASLPTLFTIGDGLFDVARSHGALQMQYERVARGITLMVGGVGGELFKDFWWLQDFPFYAKRQPNLARLYSTRIAPVRPEHSYLSQPYDAVSRHYEQSYLQQLNRYVVKGNTQTYDNIYHSVKMPDLNGRFVSNHIQLLQCYLPFLEPQIAAVGYRLPRSTRFFNGFHRRTITHYRPDLAALHTTEGGMTVSSTVPLIAGDMGKYVIDKFSRLMKKCSEKIFHKRAPQTSPNDPSFAAEVRNCGAAGRAFQDLKNRGIMRADADFHGIKDSYLGNIISLGMLFDYLEQNGRSSRS